MNSVTNHIFRQTRIIGIILSLLLYAASAFCKTYPANIAQLSGSGVHVGGVISHQHAFVTGSFSSCAAPAAGYDYKEVRNVVMLYVDDGPLRTISDTFTLTLNCLIEWKDDACTYHSRTVNLTVSYDSTRGAKHRDRHVYTFKGGNYVKVTIQSISHSSYARYVVLRSSIVVTRYGQLNTTQVPASPTCTMGSDTLLRTHWNNNDSTEEYDLEWTWVDDYDSSGGALSASTIEYNFRFNATRVTLDTPGYAFQPVYEHGWLLFRVRSVGRSGTEYKNRVLGRWSNYNIAPTSGKYLVSNYPSSAKYQITTGHRQGLTWQYSKIFTEHARFKEVITYFDGMMRSRQNVTRIESVNMAVVNEDVYDYSGRKAISVIPTPTFNKRIDFNQLFNTRATSIEYKSDDFDLDSFKCNTNAPAMGTDKGASLYYSSSNPYASNPPAGEYWHKYIPDAQGYPYSVTTYMPDPSGRVREQGGVGPYHQPAGGSTADTAGHTTKYFYGTPSQSELDALFGNDVGRYYNYESKMVTDPQGNASISYTDLKGHVIATALVGDVYTGYDTLPGYSHSGETVTLDFKDAPPNVMAAQAKEYTIQNSQSILLPNSSTTLYLKYKLKSDTVAATCLKNVHCYDCIYQLYLSVKDQCGKEVLKDSLGNPTPVVRTLGKLNNFGTWCGSGMSSYDASRDTKIYSAQRDLTDSVLQLTLPRGSYSITREIHPSEASAEDYAQRAIDSSTCLLNLDSLTKQEMAKEDTAACFITCATCMQRLGTDTNFVTNYINGFDLTGSTDHDKDSLISMAHKKYKEMKYSCDEMCRINNLGECGGIYEMLRSSFMPGGEFATITYDSLHGHYYCTDAYSLFNPDSTASIFSYKHSYPIGKIQIWVGSSYKNVKDLNPNELFNYWQPWLADSMVKIHPEYCQYTQCRKLVSSRHFDGWLTSIDSIDIVKKKKFMFPATSLGGADPALVAADSFFMQSQFAACKTKMIDTMKIFIHYGDSDYSMYKMAIAAAYCNAGTSTQFHHCLDSLLSDDDLLCDDRAFTCWEIYRSYYLSAKAAIIRKMNDTACAARVTRYPGITRLFPRNIVDTLQQVTGLPSDTSLYRAWADTQLVGNCKSVCEGYKTAWKMRLESCPHINDSLANLIMNALTIQCERGCTNDNPLGSNPNSTVSGQSRFDSVLYHFLGTACYGLSVDMPGPPGSKYSMDIWPLKNNCACSTSCKKERYFVDGVASPIPTITTDAFSYGCGCTAGGTQADFAKYMDLATGKSNGCTDKCYTCTDIGTLVSAYISSHSHILDSAQLGNMLTSYLNRTTGLNKTWAQYLAFYEACIDTVIYNDSGQVHRFINKYNSGGGDGHIESPGEEGGSNGDGFTFTSFSSPSTPTPPPSGPDDNSHKRLDTCACDSIQGMYKRWKAYHITNPHSQDYPNGFDSAVMAYTMGVLPNAHSYYEMCKYAINTDVSSAAADEYVGHWSGGSTTQLNFLATNFDVNVPIGMVCDAPTDSGGIESYNGTGQICGYLKDTIAYYRNKMQDSAWKVHTITGRDNARNYWMNKLDKVLNKIYYGHTNAGYSLAHFDSLLKYCSCEGTLPTADTPVVAYKGNTVCSSSMTHMADTLMDLLNQYINAGRFYVTDVKVKDVAGYYFSGPLNNSPNTAQTFNNTIRKLKELYDPSNARSKYAATVQHWKMVLRDNSDLPDTTTQDKDIDVYIYSKNLPDGTWPTTSYVTSFSNPVFVSDVNGTVTLQVTLNYIGRNGASESTTVVITTNYKGLYKQVCKPLLCTEHFSTSGPNSCLRFHREAAQQRAIWRYDRMRDSVYKAYKQHYLQKCYNSLLTKEVYNATYGMNRHNIALRYYDLSGNMIQTVPPAGVAKITFTTTLAAINIYRRTHIGSPIYPSHTLRSIYRLNSLNQHVTQINPDADSVKYWYDPLGRGVLSQNGDQKLENAYSYRYYDAQGRLKETGKVSRGGAISESYWPFFSSYSVYQALIAGDTKTEITRTYYDAVKYTIGYSSFSQNNLRKRVASVTYQSDDGTDYDFATHYNYDAEGNIEDVIQQISELADIGHNYKLLHYEHDLISGNVNEVNYQTGYADAWYHRYTYDADNRVTNVETSNDAIVWDMEASYHYYLHGHLARIELGDKKVQGLDYAYNVQGWIKGVNSSTAKPDYDIGQDGYVHSGNTNQFVVRDVFGFTLGYFSGDYKAAGGSGAVNFETIYRGTSFGTASPNLYNSNIRYMAEALVPFGQPVLGRAFSYDQLNRLMRSKTYMRDASANTWSGITETSLYKESFTYDANGNILSLIRHGDSTGHPGMDSLTYHYYNNTNQLQRVNDGVADNIYKYDFDNQSVTNNYTFDKRGNITADITKNRTFYWNNRGKLLAVNIANSCSGTDNTCYYYYDAMGHRVMKANTNDSSEYYVRDAQGNVIAIYRFDGISFTLNSQHIYGATRLGQRLPDQELKTGMDWAGIADTGFISVVRGLKQFELCNHLGNVLATITDRRLQRFSDTSAVNYYDADIVSAQNYYAFGSLMPKRTWTLSKDKAVYKDSCITCGLLRKHLKNYYGTGNYPLSIDTAGISNDLNATFNTCFRWSYWGAKIFTTCKLWDSIAHFYAPSSSDDAHILFSYISSYVIGTSNFSAEAWIWRDSIAGASEPTIISKEHQNPMSGEIGGFRLYLNSSGNVKFTVGDAQSIPNPPGHQATITTTSTIPFRQWKHIVAIRNGNNPNNWSIYINGTLATVTVIGPTLPSGNIEQGSNDAISVGAGIISGNNNAWHGRLAKARMYKSAISSTNITNSYNSGCGTASAVISSDLDAPLNSILLTELNHSNTGTKITGGSGTVTWSVHWRDSTCSAADSTTLFCHRVVYAINKRPQRYGFNDIERDDNIYGEGNEYTTELRQFDARLGRWFSIDPEFKDLLYQSPYCGMDNSPISLSDPSGGLAGDYYDKTSGKNLGNDGKNDNKAYVTDEKTIQDNKDGKVNWEAVQKSPSTVDLTVKYKITNSQILDRANWISGESNGQFSYYFAYVLCNLRKIKKTENGIYDGMGANVYDLDNNGKKIPVLDEDGIQKIKITKDKYGKIHKHKVWVMHYEKFQKEDYFQGKTQTPLQGAISFWKTRTQPQERTCVQNMTVANVIFAIMYPSGDWTQGALGWNGNVDGTLRVTILGQTVTFRTFNKNIDSDNPKIGNEKARNECK